MEHMNAKVQIFAGTTLRRDRMVSHTFGRFHTRLRESPVQEAEWTPGKREDKSLSLRLPGPNSVVVVDFGFTTFLTSQQVISVAFYSEREKSNKCCSEALISAWGSFTCRRSTTHGPRHYFSSEGSYTQDFLRSEKIHRPRPGLNPWTSDPVASIEFIDPTSSMTKCLPW